MQRVINLFSELSRRKVARVAAGYIVVLWALTLGFVELFPVFGLDDWAVRAFIGIGLAGLPFAVLFAWKYDLTRDGLVRDPKDFPAPPLTPVKLRAWAELREEDSIPLPLTAAWIDSTGRQRDARFLDTVLIGRDPSNDICIADPRVSRLHAMLWHAPGGWYIRDLNSSTGSYLNGERLRGSAAVPDACELQLHHAGPVITLAAADEDATLMTLQMSRSRTQSSR